MIHRYPLESLILKTKFKYHEEYKQNILKYLEEDSPPPFKDKYDTNDNFLKNDWLKGRDWERPWIKYAAAGIVEQLLMFSHELGYEKINVMKIWYQQYGYKGLHDWHIHGGNYTGVYYLEYDKTSPLTEFASPTNLESFSIEIEEGDMIFFPCFLIHRSPRSSSKNRKSIVSWNLDFVNIQPELTKKIK
tara:strand:+ start:129 stop:695 length:567 start_codon:yes stop_codon:yes gene_type:complete